MTYTEQLSNSSHSSSEASEKNGDAIPLRRLSSTSDDIVLKFHQTVDGYSRVASTGSDVRDRCRDLIGKALRKGFDNGTVAYTIQWNLVLSQYLDKN